MSGRTIATLSSASSERPSGRVQLLSFAPSEATPRRRKSRRKKSEEATPLKDNRRRGLLGLLVPLSSGGLASAGRAARCSADLPRGKCPAARGSRRFDPRKKRDGGIRLQGCERSSFRVPPVGSCPDTHLARGAANPEACQGTRTAWAARQARYSPEANAGNTSFFPWAAMV